MAEEFDYAEYYTFLQQHRAYRKSYTIFANTLIIHSGIEESHSCSYAQHKLNVAKRLEQEMQRAHDAGVPIMTPDKNLMLFCRNVAIYGDDENQQKNFLTVMLAVVRAHFVLASASDKQRVRSCTTLRHTLTKMLVNADWYCFKDVLYS